MIKIRIKKLEQLKNIPIGSIIKFGLNDKERKLTFEKFNNGEIVYMTATEDSADTIYQEYLDEDETYAFIEKNNLGVNMDWDNFICTDCGYNMYKTKKVIFKDNTKHLEARCDRCEKFIGYAPSFDKSQDSAKFIIPLKKYKGKTMEDTYNIDPGYVQWMANNVRGRVGFMAKDFLHKIDTGMTLN